MLCCLVCVCVCVHICLCGYVIVVCRVVSCVRVSRRISDVCLTHRMLVDFKGDIQSYVESTTSVYVDEQLLSI